MVDCITICNSACITCIWCILFSVWYELVIVVSRNRVIRVYCNIFAAFFGYFSFLSFPRFSRNLRKVDSSECCVRRKPMQKRRRAHSYDPSSCVRADSVHAQRRFKDSPHFEYNHENQRNCQSCHREKMYVQSCRNVRRCTKKNRETSQICSGQIEYSNSYNKSDNSLDKKNSTNIDLKANKKQVS